MLQKLKITSYAFLLFLFGFMLITVSPVFAVDGAAFDKHEVAQIERIPFSKGQKSIKSLNKNQIETINRAGQNYSKSEECTRHLQTFIDYFDNAAETAQSLIRLEKERANNQGRPIADLSPHVDNLIESVDAFRSRLEKSCNLKGLGRNLIR